MEASSIVVNRSDRVLIVGATGSGKTTLARRLLASQPHIVVLDPKGEFDPKWLSLPTLTRGKKDTAVVATRLSRLSGYQEPRPLIYRPSMQEQRNGCEEVFSWVYSRGGTILYVDEVVPLVTTLRGAMVFRPEFQRCVQMGRTRGVGVWIATQRPARIPIPLLSEAEHDFIFRLRFIEDRRRMAQYTDERVLTEAVRGHSFWYYGDKSQTFGRFTLNSVEEPQ